MNINAITDYVSIIHQDTSVYKIVFKYSSYALINSLLKTRIIKGGSTDEFYKSITFNAKSVKTVTQYQNEKLANNSTLSVIDIVNLLQSQAKQLNYLIEKESHTILGYNPDSIIVINDIAFAFLDSELIVYINPENKSITISYPFSPQDFFVSPELLQIKAIPSLIHFKTTYFSLALLLLYGFTGNNAFYVDYLIHKNPDKLMDVLSNHSIKDTKLYWLLSRCLLKDVEKRNILYI